MAHEQLQQQLNSERELREQAEEERLRLKVRIFTKSMVSIINIRIHIFKKSRFGSCDHHPTI